MVRLFISDDRCKVAVKISGDNFLNLKDSLKKNGFTFSPEGICGYPNVWVTNSKYTESLESAIDEMLEIERFEIPSEIRPLLERRSETEHFRISMREDCSRSSVVGGYQERAIQAAVRQSRLMLALKQGLGKSFVIITAMNNLHRSGLVDKIVCVCRPEGVYNMKREFLRFSTFIHEEDIYIADSTHRTPFDTTASLILMTYRCFLMLSDDAYKKKYKKESKRPRNSVLNDDITRWCGNRGALILDESHSCANRTSRWTHAITLASPCFRFRYELTGTPYPHGIEGLWSQLEILDPTIIGEDYYRWLSDICYLGDRFSQYSIRGYRDERVKYWMDKISPWIVREFADDNIELPEQIVNRSYFVLSPKHLEIYRNFVTYTISNVRNKKGEVSMKEVYNNFPAIQQALIEPGMLKGKIDQTENPRLYSLIEKWDYRDNSRIAMLDSLLEDYCDQQGKKVIVWSSHPYVLDLLEKHLKKYSPIKIHGQIAVPRKVKKEAYVNELVEKFKNEDEHRVLLASILMLSTSQNIVEAPRAIYFDRTWSFTDLDQSIKRNHRIGSTETVLVNYLIAEGSLDLRQDRVLEQRQLIDKDLLKYDSLSREQWKALFEGDEI